MMRALLWVIFGMNVLGILAPLVNFYKSEYPRTKSATAFDDGMTLLIACAFVTWTAWLLWR